ncbi:dksA/traR C4-type zinc finger [Thermomonospora echinospora]|uniref:DksA/traR C4-type zinc finger n=1 Tax=Thermomonospora echinospora TaxID=1992 RepID=A0A1H6CVK7_9ACTN|nr:TraR/DksA C4-type zinc finger protein [Thermomonospora echinospora]SEG77119.1 dksA/traR C4-type zinc finger [Thermomonospora echinospora]
MTANTVHGTSGEYSPGSTAARQARERLERERRNRAAQLIVLEGPDEGQPDETAPGRLDTLRRTLEEIEEALGRLEEGRYGLCEGCGKPIPEGRLEILPYARFCVVCQQRQRGRA